MTERPRPLQFACWVPNVSGGLVTSDNRTLARTAEDNGFDDALSQEAELDAGQPALLG